jgi:hypothetical protein
VSFWSSHSRKSLTGFLEQPRPPPGVNGGAALLVTVIPQHFPKSEFLKYFLMKTTANQIKIDTAGCLWSRDTRLSLVLFLLARVFHKKNLDNSDFGLFRTSPF